MGKYLNLLREEGRSSGTSNGEKKCVERPGPGESSLLVPGVRITWPGNEEPVILDCLHTEPDGSEWAFVTMADGWAAINAKYVTIVRTF